jgi:hypothetical protein
MSRQQLSYDPVNAMSLCFDYPKKTLIVDRDGAAS